MPELIRRGGIGALILALNWAVTIPAAADPHYKDQAARAAVDRMIDAHGGADAFFSTPALTFTFVMNLAGLPTGANGRTAVDNWRYYSVTIDPDTSRAAVTVLLEPLNGPHAGVDEAGYWRRSMTFDPRFQDPPHQLAYFHYGMVSLPFLTQVDGVSVETIDAITVPGTGRAYPALRLTFEPRPGRRHDGAIDILLDPDSGRMAGWRQGTLFPLLPGEVLPHMLDGEVGVGPVRFVDDYFEIGGLVFPRSYTTLAPNGTAGGYHLVTDIRIHDRFPVEKSRMPAGAERYTPGQ